MALSSLSSRVQILPAATPAAVRPSKRVLQVTAKQDMPRKLVSRSGVAAAAAAILLSVRTETLTNHGMQIECGRPLAVCAAYVAQECCLLTCHITSMLVIAMQASPVFAQSSSPQVLEPPA